MSGAAPTRTIKTPMTRACARLERACVRALKALAPGLPVDVVVRDAAGARDPRWSRREAVGRVDASTVALGEGPTDRAALASLAEALVLALARKLGEIDFARVAVLRAIERDDEDEGDERSDTEETR